jgi:hypothetical protein
MATIQLFITDEPLVFEKAVLQFMGEEQIVEKNQAFKEASTELSKEVETACVSLVKQGILWLEETGEEEDYIDLLYLDFQNATHSKIATTILSPPFYQVEETLQPILEEVGDVLAEKFFEEWSNQLAELSDDELSYAYFIDGSLITLELNEPFKLQETISVKELIVDYHSALNRSVQKFYEFLI